MPMPQPDRKTKRKNQQPVKKPQPGRSPAKQPSPEIQRAVDDPRILRPETILHMQRQYGNQAVLQRMKEVKRKGYGKVLIAESEEEALRVCRKEAEGDGFSFDTLGDLAKAHIVRVAQSVEEGGWKEAQKMINEVRLEQVREQNKRDRAAKCKADYEYLRDDYFEDPLALAILAQVRDRYVNGGNENPTYGVPQTQADVNAAMTEWEGVADALLNHAKNFHGFRRQDKAAVGKAQAGDTLATRGVQANFISTWGGTKINMHVDISG